MNSGRVRSGVARVHVGASGQDGRMTSERPEPPSAPDGPTEPLTGSGDRARTVGQGLGTGAKATGRGLRGMARMTSRASRYTVRQAQRAASAQGAEQSGLHRLIYLHASNAAG